MSEKEYMINGIKLTQKPLVVGQVRNLMKLLGDLEVTEDSNFSDMVEVLINDKLRELMCIIFGKDAEQINWLMVPYDVVDEVLTDFFALNPRLTGRLKSLLANLTPLGAMQTP